MIVQSALSSGTYTGELTPKGKFGSFMKCLEILLISEMPLFM